MKNKDKKFGALLKEKRFELAYTQDEMATALGMKPRMYAYYENGDYDDSKSIKIQKYLLKLASLKPIGAVKIESDSLTAREEVSRIYEEKVNSPLHLKTLYELIESKDKIINLLEQELQDIKEKYQVKQKSH